jgi:hypothetical protein
MEFARGNQPGSLDARGRVGGKGKSRKKGRIHTSHSSQAPLKAETERVVKQRGWEAGAEETFKSKREGGKIGRVGGDVTIWTAAE